MDNKNRYKIIITDDDSNKTLTKSYRDNKEIIQDLELLASESKMYFNDILKTAVRFYLDNGEVQFNGKDMKIRKFIDIKKEEENN